MANRTIPLRNAQTANRKTAPKSANGRHVSGPRVNGKALQGKPKIPGAQFIARDQILPFNKMVFGLVDPYDRGVRIFRVGKYVDRYARVLLAWRRSKSWVTGRYICMHVEKDGSRRVAVQTQGWDEAGTKPKHSGHMEFEWYDLGPKDLLAVEIGVFHACEGANKFQRQVWPDTYEALAAPEPDEWERNQKFAIPNPPSSPWSGWDVLYIDPEAPIGPKTWVAGFEVSGLRRPIIGPVRNLRQRFTVTDVRTGKEVTLGSDQGVYFGAVTGMSRNCLDRKERKLRAQKQSAKAAKEARRL
jgi:hypothetical protein